MDADDDGSTHAVTSAWTPGPATDVPLVCLLFKHGAVNSRTVTVFMTVIAREQSAHEELTRGSWADNSTWAFTSTWLQLQQAVL